MCRIVDLWDFVDREVLRIDVALKFRLERGADLAKTVPLHTVEERVLLQIFGAVNTAETVLRIADQAVSKSVTDSELEMRTR